MDDNAYLRISLSKAVPACTVTDMDDAFLEKLLFAQRLCHLQFKINSAFRSKAYEKEKGRSGLSAHCKGMAVDIATTNSKQRFIILAALFGAGFNRIGIGKNFIHVDDDLSKPYPSVFHYYD